MISIRKTICFFSAAVFMLGSPALIQAANNSTVHSAQWLMTGGARSAETQDADTPMLNPAGSALMEEGIHLNLSVAKVNDDTSYTNQDTGTKNLRQTDSWLYPLIALTYKKDDWAGFFTINIPGTSGGGKFDSRGHGMFDYTAGLFGGTAVNRSYEYFGALVAMTVGGSMKISDSISLAYGLRQLTSVSEAKARADIVDSNDNTIYTLVIDQKRNGKGIGHVIGMNIKLDKGLNIGLHYESEVAIKNKVEKGPTDTVPSVVNGAEEDDALAAKFEAGLSMEMSKKMELAADFSYFFKNGIKERPEIDSSKYQNGMGLSCALLYELSEVLELAGSIRATSGGIPDEVRYFSFMNDRTNYKFLGFGGTYKLKPDMKVIVSYGKYFWDAGATPNDSIGHYKVQQDTTMMGFGFEMKI